MISQTLLPEFDRECATTRRLLERVPDDALDWKPHEKSFSMQQLATHLTNIPSWVGSTLSQDALDLEAGFEAPPTGTGADLVRIFDTNVAAAHEALAAAGDEDLMKPWTLRSGETEHFTLPKAAVLRNFVLNHIIHHRAQLGVYLRLRDVPVPSVYGPSADEAGL
jgi:uncharacterized damage-inducible protein DinB